MRPAGALAASRATRDATLDGGAEVARHPIEFVAPIAANLPRLPTSFIGRRRELAAVRELLARERVVTLVGPGGIGKSRLAIEAAERSVGRFAGRVWHIELSEIHRSGSVELALVEAMGLHEHGRTPIDALAQFVSGRPMLLVLDGCEWVAEAVGRVVSGLMRSGPDVWVLATSRRPLNIAGEIRYEVPPMALASASGARHELLALDAVALFVDRARARRPAVRLTERSASIVHEICRRLDGMPLAIELAAARARHFELEDLLTRIANQPALLQGGPVDAPPRQRSLEATVDWSLGLLGVDARAAFPALAIFRGGFDLAAAQAVAGVAAGTPAADTLSELVDHSLLIATEGVRGRTRYHMLEPIRQRAFDLLRTRGDSTSALRRHAAYFATVAGGAATAVGTADEVLWLDRLEGELDNLRWSLEWSLAHSPHDALSIAADLSTFWPRRGHIAEGRAWLERALALATDHPRRGDVLLGLAYLLWMQGDSDGAVRRAQEAVAWSTTAHANPRLEARTDVLLAYASLSDPDRAREWFRQASRAAAAAGDEGLLVEVLGCFADGEWLVGDRALAVDAARRALTSARRIGSPTLMLLPTGVLAREATFSGSPEAESLWLDCLRASRELADPGETQYCLQFLALLAARRSDVATAAECLAEVIDISRRVGDQLVQLQIVELVGLVLCRAGRVYEGLRLIICKELAEPPDWIQSGPSRDLVHAEVEAAIASLGDRAAEARTIAAHWPFARGWAEAEREVARLQATARKARMSDPTRLSGRETEIVALAAAGLTNREIGRRLLISDRTAEAHIQHILNKLGFSKRAQIAAWAVGQGLAMEEAPELSAH